MTPYFLFGFDEYEYKNGGWDDFVGVFDTADEAMASADVERYEHWHVVNGSLLQVVKDGVRSTLDRRRQESATYPAYVIWKDRAL